MSPTSSLLYVNFKGSVNANLKAQILRMFEQAAALNRYPVMCCTEDSLGELIDTCLKLLP